jgi:hypothetical protein
MPRILKSKLDNPYSCHDCTQVFQTRGGLVQHCRRKHPLYSQISSDNSNLRPEEYFVPETPSILHGKPDIIAESSYCVPDKRKFYEIDPSTSEPQTSQSIILISPDTSSIQHLLVPDIFQEIQNTPNTIQPEEDEDSFIGDSDTETSDSDLAIIDSSSNKYKPPETFISDDILPHPNAGYIYDAPGQKSRVFEIQEHDHREHGHPYYPWASDNELWLSHFIQTTKMTIGTTDIMMGGIKEGRLAMNGLASTSARQMLTRIDNDATYIPVCLNFIFW